MRYGLIMDVLLIGACVLGGCEQTGQPASPTDAETKELISKAAGVSRDTFQKIVESGGADKVLRENSNKPLTLWLAARGPGVKGSKDFTVIGGTANPVKLMDALTDGQECVH